MSEDTLKYNGPLVKTKKEKFIVNGERGPCPVLPPEPTRALGSNEAAVAGSLDNLALAGMLVQARDRQVVMSHFAPSPLLLNRPGPDCQGRRTQE